MSRGAWIILIGGILLIVGIGLFAASVFGLVSGFDFETTTLGPGDYENKTVSLQASEVLTYVVSIADYTQGDQVTVFVKSPTGAEENRTVVTSQDYTNAHIASEAGDYMVVIQNTGSDSVSILHFAGRVDISVALLVLVAMGLGAVGFIILIVGIIIWAIDRRKTPTPPGDLYQ